MTPYESFIMPTILMAFVGFVYISAEPTRNRVIRLLKKHCIDYRSWESNPEANNLDTLVSWIQSGEAWLEDHPDNILIVHIHVAVATIYYEHNGQNLVLREFRNGKRRPYSGSLGEKVWEKDPADTIRRGLVEELGKTEPRFLDTSRYNLVFNKRETDGPTPSNFFPGAFDTYHRELFEVRIGSDLFHKKYVSRDNGRDICFMWRRPDDND